jgi:hypothetical protein
MKNRPVIINAENFKNIMALWDSFPFHTLRTFKFLGKYLPFDHYSLG